jgi:hypothetical protein
MSKIDLSQANVGDKFRLKNGVIATYKCYSSYSGAYVLESGLNLYAANYDGTASNGRHEHDVIEQVLDKPLDELIEEGTKQIKENDGAIAEGKELQRRKEVVELADRIFFSERGSAYSFKECIEVAEHSVNMINQYLKEGKLC